MTKIPKLLITPVLLTFALLAGCSSGPSASTDRGDAGNAQVTIAWAAISGAASATVESVRVEARPLVDAPALTCEYPQSLLITRAQGKGTFTALRSGPVSFAATAYATLDGSGGALATGATQAVIQPNTVTSVTISLSAAPIDRVLVWDNPAYVTEGASISLWAEAKDTGSNTVLLSDTSPFTWELLSGVGVIALSSSGVVTGLTEGAAIVRATEPTSGKWGETTVTVLKDEDPEPDPDPPPDVFYFVKYASGIYSSQHVIRVNFDGTGYTDLTPTWVTYAVTPDGVMVNDYTYNYVYDASPDGRLLSLVRYQDIWGGSYYTGWRNSLWVMGTDGSNPREIYDAHKAGLGRPLWSPDSSQLLTIYSDMHSAGAEDDEYGLAIIDAVTGQLTRHLATVSGNADEVFSYELPVWSPNGSDILLVQRYWNWASRTGSTQFAFYNLATRAKTVIADPIPFNRPVHSVHYSPDGSQIYFARQATDSASGPLTLYVMNADGANLRTVVAEVPCSGFPMWSPNVTAFACATSRGLYQSVFDIVDLNGGGHTEITLPLMYEDGPLVWGSAPASQ